MAARHQQTGIIGDGRLALAIAHLVAKGGTPIWLYAPDPGRRAELLEHRRLPAVLPRLDHLHEGVSLASHVGELTAACRLIFFTGAGADADTERVLIEAGDHLDGSHQICHAHHQLHGPELQTTAARIRACTPVLQIGAMAGPLHVDELLAGKPNAVVVASPFPDLLRRVKKVLDLGHLRIYTSNDLLGVELSAALVQVVALAVGIADALSAGVATHATLMVRGLAELTRIGERLGARGDTFDGLSGLARLLDGTRRGSPNHELGKLVAEGVVGAELAARAPAEAQGLELVPALRRFAEEAGLRASITTMLDEILSGRITATQVLQTLMAPPAEDGEAPEPRGKGLLPPAAAERPSRGREGRS